MQACARARICMHGRHRLLPGFILHAAEEGKAFLRDLGRIKSVPVPAWATYETGARCPALPVCVCKGYGCQVCMCRYVPTYGGVWVSVCVSLSLARGLSALPRRSNLQWERARVCLVRDLVQTRPPSRHRLLVVVAVKPKGGTEVRYADWAPGWTPPPPHHDHRFPDVHSPGTTWDDARRRGASNH